jgi:hypothetical protein
MNKRSDDLADVVRSEAAALGATIVETGITRSNHRFALLELRGKRRKIFFSGSPSSVRAPMQTAGDVRRVFREREGLIPRVPKRSE